MSSLFDDISRSVASGESRRHVLKMILAGTFAGGTFAPLGRVRAQAQAVCCPNVCCAGVCCDPGEICDGNKCVSCPSGPCGTVCCSPEEECIGGECVPKCATGRERCFGTQCCEQDSICCDFGLSTARCVRKLDLCGGEGGICCSSEQCCPGPVCCPELCGANPGECAQCDTNAPFCGGVCCPISTHTCSNGQCFENCVGNQQQCGLGCCDAGKCCGGDRPENQVCCTGEEECQNNSTVCVNTGGGLLSFPVEAHADGSVTLSWETAGMNHAGFNLYRMRALGGSPVKINDTLIPAQGDAVFGASYSFVDKPGVGTFRYLLADVHTDCETTLHGPIEVKVRRS